MREGLVRRDTLSAWAGVFSAAGVVSTTAAAGDHLHAAKTSRIDASGAGVTGSLRLAAKITDKSRVDIVIRGGKIVDGTGNPWFEGDVAIRGDRIAAVIRPGGDVQARRTIDAHGLIVAPGFIDMHSHSDLTLLEDGSAPSKVRQGVTTEILGEDTSAGPAKGNGRRNRGRMAAPPARGRPCAGTSTCSKARASP